MALPMEQLIAAKEAVMSPSGRSILNPMQDVLIGLNVSMV